MADLRQATILARDQGKMAALTEYAKALYDDTGQQMILPLKGGKYKKWDGKQWRNGVFNNKSTIKTRRLSSAAAKP